MNQKLYSLEGKVKKTKGFTIVEIIVAIAILAILFAISIPNLLRLREDVIRARTQADLRGLYKAITMYWTCNRVYPTNWDDLKGYIEVSRFKDRFVINDDLN